MNKQKIRNLALLAGVMICSNAWSAADSSNVRCITQWAERPAYVLLVDDDYAFVTSRMCWDVLFVFDVSNPDALERLGTHELGNVNELAKVGDYLYATRTIHQNFLLEITDVEDPSIMRTVGRCDLGEGHYIGGICVSGCHSNLYAYITTGDSGVVIMDISNPSIPRVISSCNTGGCARGISVSGDYAYVAAGSSGVWVLNVADPAMPYGIGNCDTPGYARDLCISGDHVYIADGDWGIRVIDVSDPESPSEIGYFETADYARAVDIQDSFAYVADGAGGLRVIDISDPSAPEEAGYYELMGMNAEAMDVDVCGHYTYLAYHTEGMLILQFAGQAVEESSVAMKGGFDIRVTPNPANSRAMVQYSSAIERNDLRLILYDVAGRPVLDMPDQCLVGHTGSVPLDLSSLCAGVYFLKVSAGGVVCREKLLITK